MRRYPRGYVKVGVDTGRETLTQQHMGQEVDINTIVRRFGLTKAMPSGPAGGVYGDFTGISDYDSAVAAISRAEEGFLSLDAELRYRFDNDPGKYLAFVGGLSESELEEIHRPRAVAPVAPVAPISPSEGSGSAAT